MPKISSSGAQNKVRPFLKWAGGKYRLIDKLQSQLPEGKRLIEPFVGAGSIFLNTNYESYLLNDINSDLIALYKAVQKDIGLYLADSQEFFENSNNNKKQYYLYREKFNQSGDSYYRSLLFLYLNRHGYNGLCRYNKSGGYNVPFGSYVKPYFPKKELLAFAEKAQRASFICGSYQDTIKQAKSGDVVYCDPPYVPLSSTARFTSYSANDFSLDHQALLAKLARNTSKKKQVSILISNHDTPLTRELYHGSELSEISVQRNISRNGTSRNKVGELMALYKGKSPK